MRKVNSLKCVEHDYIEDYIHIYNGGMCTGRGKKELALYVVL